MAAGRDGGAHTGFGFDPRGDHGDRRCLPYCPSSFSLCSGALGFYFDRGDWGFNRALCRYHRAGSK